MLAAVVAAAGGDDLLRVVHGAAVARPAGMVHQSELLLAGTHAYAGQSRVTCLQLAFMQTRSSVSLRLVCHFLRL